MFGHMEKLLKIHNAPAWTGHALSHKVFKIKSNSIVDKNSSQKALENKAKILMIMKIALLLS